MNELYKKCMCIKKMECSILQEQNRENMFYKFSYKMGFFKSVLNIIYFETDHLIGFYSFIQVNFNEILH